MENLLKVTTLFLFFSCSIQIQENHLFIPSPYNLVADLNRIDEFEAHSEAEKEQMKLAFEKIVLTNDEKILITDSIEIKRDFFKPNDSITLEYFNFSPKKAHQIIIFHIGNGSRITQYIRSLAQMSIHVEAEIYVLNYRGYGKSEGTPSFYPQFQDNNIFFNKIKTENPGIKIKTIGYSLGSVFGTYLALDNEIDNLFLLAPFSDPKTMIKHVKRQMTKGVKFPLRPFIRFKVSNNLMEISNVSQIEKYNGSLQIIHGKNDRTLPLRMAKELYEKARSNNKKLEIVAGGHEAPFTEKTWMKLINEIK